MRSCERNICFCFPPNPESKESGVSCFPSVSAEEFFCVYVLRAARENGFLGTIFTENREIAREEIVVGGVF